MFERCGPGAFVSELQGRRGALFLLTWPHMGVRVETFGSDEARLCKHLRRAGAPPELLQHLEASTVTCRIRVAPHDVDGRAMRLTRRLAETTGGIFMHEGAWWDEAGAFLGVLVGSAWSSAPESEPDPLLRTRRRHRARDLA